MDATAARAPRPRSAAVPHPLTAELERLACATAAVAGLEVRGVEVLTHRIPMTLRVLVQRADGTDVSLDECAAFSGPLGEAIEAVLATGYEGFWTCEMLSARHWEWDPEALATSMLDRMRVMIAERTHS